MTEYLTIAGNTIAYDVTGQGPLVVLAHGIGDSRHSYRFLAPALAAAGYRVANVDIRGCGDSSLGWDGYSRTDIAGDLVALVRHLGGPAVIIGQSISGGAATIAAATAPDLITGVIELAPFTRAQPFDLGGLMRVKRFRAGYTQLAQVMLRGSLASWKKYLDLALPGQARRLGRRAGPHRGQAERARPDEGPAGHVQDQPGRRRRAAGQRHAARSWSSRAASTPTGPTRAPRARRSSPTCPTGLGELAVIDGRRSLPARPDARSRSSRWPCRSWPRR